MVLENLLSGYPSDDGAPGVFDFNDFNPPDVLPELGSLFSPGGSLVVIEIPGIVARPGIHYDRYLNSTNDDDSDGYDEYGDDVELDNITRILTIDDDVWSDLFTESPVTSPVFPAYSSWKRII
jgi:hypothetical protein